MSVNFLHRACVDQGDRKGRPYPTTSGPAKPSMVGATLAVALEKWLKFAPMGTSPRPHLYPVRLCPRFVAGYGRGPFSAPVPLLRWFWQYLDTACAADNGAFGQAEKEASFHDANDGLDTGVERFGVDYVVGEETVQDDIAAVGAK